ncbi:MAG: hypothetical protein WCO94_12885 [Verrucomicrobiota bacterium]
MKSSNAPDSVLVEIETQMTVVADEATPMVNSLLQAQLKVLHFVREPELVGAPVDLMFEKLYISLDHAASESERKWLRQQTSLTLHSFLFFVQAMFVFERKETRNEGRRLLKEGAGMLAESMTQSIQHGFSGKNALPGIAEDFAQNLVKAVTQESDQASFLSRIANWFSALLNDDNRYLEYIGSTSCILNKIERNQKLLGKSIALSEMLHERITEVCSFWRIREQSATASTESEAASCRWRNYGCLWALVLGITLILGVVYLFCGEGEAKITVESWFRYGLICIVGLYLIQILSKSVRSLTKFVRSRIPTSTDRLEKRWRRMAENLRPQY